MVSKSWMRALVLGAMALVFGGCAETVWVKPGATQSDFNRDSYECERDARMSAGSFGGGIGGAIEARGFMERCMGVRGYTKTKKEGAALPGEEKVLTTAVEFNPSEIAWAAGEGPNTVEGNAVLRLAAGETKPCIYPTSLVPDSAYSRSRLMILYGNVEQAQRSYDRRGFVETPKEFLNSARHEQCDGAGNFTFRRVPNGRWYVIARVLWGQAAALQGTFMMRRVDVAAGQVVKVILP